MSFFSALLKAYDDSLENQLVDIHDGDNTVLLPLYHTNLKARGEDIVQVTLNTDGEIFKVEFLPKDQIILFPVTNDSVARSGKNPPSHPLVDKMNYLASEEKEAHQMYLDAFNSWYHSVEEGEVKRYLTIIKKVINRSDFFDQILKNLFPKSNYRQTGFIVETQTEENKKNSKVDFSKVFVTFVINDFLGYKNVSVTEYVALHQTYIQYVESQNREKGYCNISGNFEQLTQKHRGLMGNAKLISVSNNIETYKGRFQAKTDIIQVGYQTSEKIHLMLKYLLENKNSRRWLGGQQYLVNWFSEDIANQSGIDIMNLSSLYQFSSNQAKQIQKPVTSSNRSVNDPFVSGAKKITNRSGYYIAIIDKSSNGRISLKYFRELNVSQLKKRLEDWQRLYNWEFYYPLEKTKKPRIPSFSQIILAAYGVERDKKLQLDNDSFQKDQFQKLVVCLIDGRPIPSNILSALDQRIRKRLNYADTWRQIEFTTLALYSHYNGKELSPVLDKENKNRSYLFGRLLALFERIEEATYLKEEGVSRNTNAQKFWTTYTNKPASTMQILFERIKPYEKRLGQSNYGLLVKIQKEEKEVIQLLHENYLDKKELNQPLDYHFIFGYYAQMQYLFTKNEKKESEEITDDYK